MREIKFRAWDTKEKTMDWSGDIMDFQSAYSWFYNIEDMEWCNNIVLMQYTGLKDKDGKEIYEGDVLLHHHRYADWRQGPIKWGEYEDAEGFGIMGYDLNQGCADDAEVIGNIYENPDLLEDK